MREMDKLVAAIDELENVLARYFADKEVPMEVQRAVTELEVAMIEAGLSPLTVSGLAQRVPDPADDE